MQVNNQRIYLSRNTVVQGTLSIGAYCQVIAAQDDGELIAVSIQVGSGGVTPTPTPAPTPTPVPTPAPTPTPTTVSYSGVIQPLLNANCIACHSTNGSAGVTLTSYSSTMSTVVAGNAANSLLYKAVTGNGVTKMPIGGSLSAAQIQSIADWINQGALNN